VLVYKNRVQPGRHWIAFDLEGRPSNRSAIGARVELRWGGRTQVQEVSGGSGFSAQNQRRLHYGLGAHTGVDRVEIRWPSGQRQHCNPPIDRLHHAGGALMAAKFFRPDNRLLPPLLITSILITAHLTFGIPEA
jgi:hypothetical protein